MLRRVLVLAASGVLIVMSGAVARADDWWGTVDCGQNPYPGCELAAGYSGGVTSGPDGTTETVNGNGAAPYDGPACRHVPVDYVDPVQQPAGPGRWVFVLCSPDGKDPWSHGPVWIPDGADIPMLSPEQVAQIARERLRLPTPVIAASPAGDQLVNLPTWLWLAGSWQAVSATASVPGVSVTATAVPISVTWSMGDGGTVTCTGPGTSYATSADPASASPDCGYTYRTSSASQRGETFEVTATVDWTATWSGAGESGAFPTMTTSATVAFRVAESQAVATG